MVSIRIKSHFNCYTLHKLAQIIGYLFKERKGRCDIVKESMNTLLVCLGLLSTYLLVPTESSPGKLQILLLIELASYTSS